MPDDLAFSTRGNVSTGVTCLPRLASDDYDFFNLIIRRKLLNFLPAAPT